MISEGSRDTKDWSYVEN